MSDPNQNLFRKQAIASTRLSSHLAGLHEFSREVTLTGLDIQEGPSKALRVVRRLAKLLDREIEGYHREAAEATAYVPAACCAGCFHCCYQPVSASPLEVLAAADEARSVRSSEELEELRARVDRVVESYDELIAKPRTTPYPLPCTLLSEDGRCSVWTARPFICRGWNSVDVAPCIEKQHSPMPGPDVPKHEMQMILAAEFWHGVTVALEERGLEAERCDLALGLQVALSHQDALERYLAGEPIFANAVARTQELRAALQGE